MSALRRHWRAWLGVLAGLPAILNGILWLVGLGGSIDFVISRSKEPGWVGDVIGWLLNPPGWAILGSLALGLFLIWRDTRQAGVMMGIDKVEFDPNGPTEFYVSFEIINRGYPTTVRDWSLSVSRDGVPTLQIPPRVLFPSTFNAAEGRLIEGEDLTKRPLESGARRDLRFTFTLQGNARDQLQRPGTRLRLTGIDVHGKTIKADYVFPSASF